MKKIITILVFIISLNNLYADSPITSTTFYTFYSDVVVVEKAHQSGTVDDTIADYLLSDTVAIDVKAAIINALSWNFNGKNNASLLTSFIMKKYSYSNGFDLNVLSAEDIFCLGYLTIMDNYFQTEKPIKILTLASSKDPKSFTIQMILALAIAQHDMESDFCAVYKGCVSVKNNMNLKQDMKQNAVDAIFSYINIYKPYCNEKK
ncbi:MAG: hypothetical protein V1904_04455 [Bacteroidota bacterium]